MKRSTIGTTLALSLALGLLPVTWANAATAPFAYTGGEQTFTVPANVHAVHIVAVGAKGGGIPGTIGGAGAVIGGDVAVSPGQILYIEVGGTGSAGDPGAGGFNGGGPSGHGAGAGDSYGGGGGSDVRTTPRASADSLASRLVAAGGGGGASTSAGGAAGSAGSGSGGGGPGTSSSAGMGGGGATASNGQFGVGGPGAVSASDKGGGGGGGGYFGGGGGSGGYGGGGGSSVSVSGGSFTLDTSGVPSVTITYTAVAPGGQSDGGGGGPTASGLAFSHSTFAAEASGPSAYTVRRKAPLGAKVSFRLSEAAKVRFTVTRRAKGRKVKRGKKTVCVKPTKKSRKRKRCTRVVTLKGSFSRNGVAGNNSFHFTGRLRGRKLKPGRYRLVATPTAGGKKGKPTSRGFRIVR